MKYQDIWLNGKTTQRGTRECESRYEIVKQFCSERLGKNFSVLDIGANMAYFDIRLIEDFNAVALAFEFHQYDKRAEIIKKQNTNRLMYINRKVQLDDIKNMRCMCNFDLVLAMSVLHHLSEPSNEWIAALKGVGKYVIAELAGGDSGRYQYKHKIDFEYKILGYADSHLKENYKREIVLFES